MESETLEVAGEFFDVIFSNFKRHLSLMLVMQEEPKYHDLYNFYLKVPMVYCSHEFRVAFFNGLVYKRNLLIVQNSSFAFIPMFINFFFNILQSIEQSLRDYVIFRLFDDIICKYFEIGNDAAKQKGENVLAFLMSRPEVESESIARCLLKTDFSKAIKAKETIFSLICPEDLQLVMKGMTDEKVKATLKKIHDSEELIPKTRKEAIAYYFSSPKL